MKTKVRITPRKPKMGNLEEKICYFRRNIILKNREFQRDFSAFV